MHNCSANAARHEGNSTQPISTFSLASFEDAGSISAASASLVRATIAMRADLRRSYRANLGRQETLQMSRGKSVATVAQQSQSCYNPTPTPYGEKNREFIDGIDGKTQNARVAEWQTRWIQKLSVQLARFPAK